MRKGWFMNSLAKLIAFLWAQTYIQQENCTKHGGECLKGRIAFALIDHTGFDSMAQFI